MKKILCFVLALAMALAVSGCGKTKTLTCDGCGKTVEVSESSNMTDEWLVFCEDCQDDVVN